MTKLPIFIQKLLFFCLILPLGSELIAQSDAIKVRNEGTINTAFQEYSPAFYQNGLVFIASNPAVPTEKKEDSNTGKATTSIFFTTRNGEGNLQAPAPFAEELTTKFYDGPLSFNSDGSIVYFTRSNLKRGKPIKAKDGLVKLKIYSAEKKDNKWVNIQELPFNSAEFDCEHPSVSSDGRRLYFSSNRPGGFGGMDLYVSTLINNKWSDPVNLGPKINTDKNEIFPFSHPDGKVIFASNGHEGIGNLDIFFTMKTDTGWLYPRILPEPINSRSDDFGLIVSTDKKLGYFSSNRASGQGDDDIFNIDFSTMDAETIFPKIDTRTLSPDDLATNTTESVPESATTKVETPKLEKKEEIAQVEEKKKEPTFTKSEDITASEGVSMHKNKVEVEADKKPEAKTNTHINEGKKSEPSVVKNKTKVPEVKVDKNEGKKNNVAPSAPAVTKLENKNKKKNETAAPTAANAPLSTEPSKPTESVVVANTKKNELTTKEKKKTAKNEVAIVAEPQFDESTIKVPKDTTNKIVKLDDGGFEEHTIVVSSNDAKVVIEPEKNVVEKPLAPVETKTKVKIVEKPAVTTEAASAAKKEEIPNIEPITPKNDSLKGVPEYKHVVSSTELMAATEPSKKEEKPMATNTVIAQDKVMKKFLVVVGTYSIMENATIQKKIALNKGFDETEIIQYHDTHLYGVCVKQFDNEKEAQALVRAISNKKGLDAFVKVLK